MKSERDFLEGISVKLDRILGMMAIRDLEDNSEKIRRLRDLDLDNATISAVTGLTKNAVAIRLTRMKRSGGE